MPPVLGQEGSESENNPGEESTYYLSWGSAEDGVHQWRNTGEIPCLRTIGPITKKGDNYQFKVLSQTGITSGTNDNYYYGQSNNKQVFGKLVRYDSINQVWLDNVPGLEDAMKEFVKNAHTQREQTNNSNQRFGLNRNTDNFSVRVKVTLTLEQAKILNQKLVEEYESLAKQKMSAYAIRTHERLGMNSGKIPYRYFQPDQYRNEYSRNEDYVSMYVQTFMNSGQQKKPGPLPSEEVKIISLGTGGRKQNFPIDLHYNNSQELSLEAVLTFYQTTVVVSANRERGRNNQVTYIRHQIYLPTVSGLVLVGRPSKITPDGVFEQETIQRVRDRTQKRQIKGGYRGPYQGLGKLTYAGETLFRVSLAGGLKAIATGEPIKNFKLETTPRLPLSMEDYIKIERPMTNIKPIEVGHLNLYRISESPKKLVTGEILSDLQLPSMPDFMLAIDTDIRIESNDELYVDGSECSGDCQHEKINLPISPGLYVVKKKERCVISHDPGRPEYNVGFGTICNDGITIRRLLSQLNIHYDQFRGNMVGNSIEIQETDFSVSAGSLLGRLS